jgi:hypothetical protein
MSLTRKWDEVMQVRMASSPILARRKNGFLCILLPETFYSVLFGKGVYYYHK